jgi:hypothetical protein
MKRTTALLASATMLAAGLASMGGVSYAANQGTPKTVTATPHMYKFKLPPTTGVSNVVYSFPGLVPHIYNASYSITADMSSPGATINCNFVRPNGDFQLLQYGGKYSSFSTVSASGALDMGGGNNPIKFHCFTDTGTFTIENQSPHSSVTFTQMGSIHISPAATVAKSSAKVAGHSAAAR